MNFSKSGIGYSVGVRGARVGRDPKGRKYSQLSIPNTGIYRRDYYSNPKPQNPSSPVPQNHITQPLPPRLPQPSNPGIQWGSVIRSPWVLYGGGGALLYALIRAIF
jgi:hypothetical protein